MDTILGSILAVRYHLPATVGGNIRIKPFIMLGIQKDVSEGGSQAGKNGIDFGLSYVRREAASEGMSRLDSSEESASSKIHLRSQYLHDQLRLEELTLDLQSD